MIKITNKKQILMTIPATLAIYFACSSFFATPPFGIRKNVSESFSYKYFFSRPFKTLKRGRYVSFSHLKSFFPLVKQIIGLPGDLIEVKNNRIYVNHQDFGEILKNTSTGRILTPVSQCEVPEGYVFVYAPHPESFDSRYQEFGLIPIAHLEETLCPIY